MGSHLLVRRLAAGSSLMPGLVQVQVLGLRELEAKLVAIGVEYGPKAAASPVRSALRKGGVVIQKAAQQIVHKKSGTLSRNIIVTSHGSRPREGFIDMKVTVRAKAKSYKPTSKGAQKFLRGTGPAGYADYGPLFYGRFLEFGTKGSKGHAATAAYPYMRPAFEQTKATVPGIIRDALSDAIDKTIAKLGHAKPTA
jgi:HK97 gp10 family phage protein